MALRGVSGLSRAQTAGLLAPGGVYRSGQRVGLPLGTGNANTNAVAADIMYAWPIPIAAPVRLSGMEIQVGTLTVGVLGKLGVALPGTDGLPAVLLAECAAAVDCNSAADTILQGVITGGVLAPAGFVWGLCVFNGAAQPVTTGQASTPGLPLGHFIGNLAMNGYTGRGGVGATVRVQRAHTYATAFPASLTGWTTANNVFSSPIMVGVVA